MGRKLKKAEGSPSKIVMHHSNCLWLKVWFFSALFASLALANPLYETEDEAVEEDGEDYGDINSLEAYLQRLASKNNLYDNYYEPSYMVSDMLRDRRRSSMADNNFQLRVRKRSWGNTLPSAESNFQLRVRKDFLDRIRQSPHLRSTAENNFQLRVRKSDPNMPIGQRAARQTLLEKIRDRRFGQRMADNNFQLRVRRSPELTQSETEA